MFAATASSGILLPVANNILAALNSTKVELMLYIVVRQQYTALLEAVVTVGNSKSIVNPLAFGFTLIYVAPIASSRCTHINVNLFK